MRIAIVNLTSGGLSGGYQKYLRRLVPLLRQDHRVASVDVFMHPAGMTVGADGIVQPTKRLFPSGPSRAALRRQIRSARPDVLFIPTARYIRVDRIPTVVMVRNMEPLLVPWSGNDFGEGCKNVLRAGAARRACRRADRVIAVSQFVGEFIEHRWSIDPSRIGVVHHGVDQPAVEEPTVPAALRSEQNPGEPFLFTAGSIRPARGLEDVIGALGLARRSGIRTRLVVAGQTDPSGRRYAERARTLASELGIADQIVWAGSLTTRELTWCFDNCAAFIMTSRAEACPNIALEAMASGALCVSTDTPPMPEFYQSAALYYRAGQPASLADVLRQTLQLATDDRLRLTTAARRRAGEFSWSATARSTIDELMTAVASARSGVTAARFPSS